MNRTFRIVHVSLMALILLMLTSPWWSPLVFRKPGEPQLCHVGMTLAPGESCRIELKLYPGGLRQTGVIGGRP